MVLRQQGGNAQTNVTCACHGDLYVFKITHILCLIWFTMSLKNTDYVTKLHFFFLLLPFRSILFFKRHSFVTKTIHPCPRNAHTDMRPLRPCRDFRTTRSYAHTRTFLSEVHADARQYLYWFSEKCCHINWFKFCKDSANRRQWSSLQLLRCSLSYAKIVQKHHSAPHYLPTFSL